MSRLVELLPRVSFGESKVGAGVDQHGVGMQLGSNLARSAVRQREEDHVMISEYLRQGLRHKPITEWDQLRVVLA